MLETSVAYASVTTSSMMQVLAYANSLACAIVFAYCFAVAVLIPHKGMWLNRLTMCAVAWASMAEVIAPWTSLVPPTAWQSSALHIALAWALIAWRREAMCFIRTKFTVPKPKDEGPKRRSSDFVDLDISEAMHVSGGRKG